MGLHRSHRRHMERQDAIETKAKNVVHKDKERGRRDVRMLATIKGARLPFAPTVMTGSAASWTSRRRGSLRRTSRPSSTNAASGSARPRSGGSELDSCGRFAKGRIGR